MRIDSAIRPSPPDPGPPDSCRPQPGSGARCWASGVASLDAVLAGGLAYGRVHEVYAAEADDASAAAGFVAALAAGMAAGAGAGEGAGDGAIVWLRSRRSARQTGIFQANGWAELGGAPGRGLFGVMDSGMALLRTAVDALRCAALGAVVVEGWGPIRELDLTASRRLALAAGQSGVPLLLLRIDAAPLPSAAQTRWQVGSAPSRALPGQAPGRPTFDITLLRQRSGPCGLGWQLEWDRDQRRFQDAALSGAVVSVPADRPVAAGGTGIRPPDGRRAA